MKDFKRSNIFRSYNLLKNDSKTNPAIEIKRLNKALGIAMTKNYQSKYFTTLISCTCPDATQRGIQVCKHRLAYMMLHPAEMLEQRFNEEGPWDKVMLENLFGVHE